MEGHMFPPAIPGPSTSRATSTMGPTENISEITQTRIKVEEEESDETNEDPVPPFDDGSSSIRSQDTEFLPAWVRRPSVSCLGTPAYSYAVSHWI